MIQISSFIFSFIKFSFFKKNFIKYMIYNEDVTSSIKFKLEHIILCPLKIQSILFFIFINFIEIYNISLCMSL